MLTKSSLIKKKKKKVHCESREQYLVRLSTNSMPGYFSEIAINT